MTSKNNKHRHPFTKLDWSLTEQDVSRIAFGATLLGAGGGGDPYLCQLAVRHLIRSGKTVEIGRLEDLDDNARIVCIAGFGAPTVEAEKMHTNAAIVHALHTFEDRFGGPADALVSAEMGGGNSLIPMIAAAETGLPIIDGDGMGRAFPELQMTSYYLNGISGTPFVLTDDHLNVITCEIGTDPDPKKAEAFARSATIEMGMTAYIACYAMTGRQAKTAVLPGTLTQSLVIGRAAENARLSERPFHNFLAALNREQEDQICVHLFDGKVVDLWRSTEKGFAVGWCELEGLDQKARRARAEFQNEYLAFRIDGHLHAIAPDLICLIDRDTLQPVPTPLVRYGQRIAVLGISCHRQFRSEKALKVVGPRAFGFDEDYVPLEDLNAP